jgi:hypothetical protein
MRAVIIYPMMKPEMLKNATALVLLIAILVLNSSPRKAPKIRPATGIK